MQDRRLAPPEHGGMNEREEIRLILDHFISKQVRGKHDGIRQIRRWLWKLWRFEALTLEDVSGFLVRHQNRSGCGYREGPRYETLFRSDGFLRAFYGRATQELRPVNYISRHFGNSWMNVQKVLRLPPGRPQDPLIHRWAYHRFHIDWHRKTLEHLVVSANIEKLVEIAKRPAVAVVSSGGVNPLIAGEEVANNELLERYKKLTDPMPHRKPRSALHHTDESKRITL